MSASSARAVTAATATVAATAAAPPPDKKQRMSRDVKKSDPSSVFTATTTPAAAVAVAPSTPSASGGAKAITKAKFCINCQKELARNIRITCVECLSPTTQRPLIELCVECFAVGIELGEHKKTHKYTVSDCLAFPVVRESREYAQSMREASSAVVSASAPVAAAVTTTLQKDSSSTGNSSSNTGTSTSSIATSTSSAVALLSSDWTADEELLLLEGIEMFGMGNWKDIAEHVGSKSEKKCETHYMGAYLSASDLMPRFLDDPVDAVDSAAASDAAKAAAVVSPVKPGTAAAASSAVGASLPPSLVAAPAKTSGSELAGYMPLRGDFDVEYDNEAELILADMEFADDDHPTERELKLKVIEIYNAKLDERERRKRFVIDRGLLDYKRHQQLERRRPKEERELVAQMRPFARYQTPAEHDAFVAGLLSVMRLRKQILLLQEYRKNGVRTLAEAELYDAERKKRETELALQKQRDGAAYLYESHRPASSSRDRATRWLNRESDPAAGDKASRDGDHARTRGAAAAAGSSDSAANGATAAAATSLIDGAPGCHLLTPQEKELCAKLKLLPKHYLVIKDALIRECFRLGYLTKKSAKEIVKIDVNKTGHIYDFFVKCGWVTTESAAPKVSASPSAKSGDAVSAAGGAATNSSATNGAQPSVLAASSAPTSVPASAATTTTTATTETSANTMPLKRKAHEMSAAASGAEPAS